MEEELVSTLFPKGEPVGDVELINPRSPFAYTRFFEDALPYFMVMGMSPQEFWEGDASLARAYRQAYDMKMDTEFNIRNEQAWIQGMYIYATLLKISPLFSSFADSKTKYGDYMDKPFDFGQTEDEEVSEEIQEQRERDKNLARMRGWVANFDHKFGNMKEQGESNATS